MIDAVEMEEGHYRVVFGPIFNGDICDFVVAAVGLKIDADVVFDYVSVVNGRPVGNGAHGCLG